MPWIQVYDPLNSQILSTLVAALPIAVLLGLLKSLQRITAERLGLNPILICTENSTGGVMGKMIDAPSIVVSAVATQRVLKMGVQWLRIGFLQCVLVECFFGNYDVCCLSLVLCQPISLFSGPVVRATQLPISEPVDFACVCVT